VQVNDQYYNGSGPLFLFVEGEGAGSSYDVLAGQHVELAASYGALIIALEHRYYGASIPTPDFSIDNLAYLSSHQAVGDVARFLGEFVPTQWNVTRVITFGGSYPGALSAWLRLRLPHLVYGSFSTSSPVGLVVDFTGYNDVVAASLNSTLVGGSPSCLAAVTEAFAVIDAALRGSPSQQAAISQQMSRYAADGLHACPCAVRMRTRPCVPHCCLVRPCRATMQLHQRDVSQ
jgi:serine protease 16